MKERSGLIFCVLLVLGSIISITWGITSGKDNRYVPITINDIALQYSYDSLQIKKTARIIRAMSDSTLYALFGEYNFVDEYPEGERDSCNCILDDDE